MQNIKIASIHCILKPINTQNTQTHKICFNSALNHLFSLRFCSETFSFDLITAEIGKTGEKEHFSSDTFSVFSLSSDTASPLAPSDHLVSFDYIPSLESLCFVTHSGLVGLYKIYQKLAETAGVLEEGVSSASWCPNKQLLALTSLTGEVWLMTTSFDTINQNSFAKENEQIRFSATNWRSDGKFFSVLAEKSVFVFDGDGKSVSKSGEMDSGRVSGLAWNKESNLITVAALDESEPVVRLRLIECNGLFHGESRVRVPLSEGKTNKIRLSFNRKSDILAIFDDSMVAFCVEQNSKVYLKRVLSLESLTDVIWKDNDEIIVLSGVHGALLVKLNPAYDVSQSGAVVAINGGKLYFTDFSKGFTPPPLYQRKVKFSDCVSEKQSDTKKHFFNGIIFQNSAKNPKSANFCCFGLNNFFYLFDGDCGLQSAIDMRAKLSEKGFKFLFVRTGVWIENSIFVVFVKNLSERSDSLVRVRLTVAEGDNYAFDSLQIFGDAAENLTEFVVLGQNLFSRTLKTKLMVKADMDALETECAFVRCDSVTSNNTADFLNWGLVQFNPDANPTVIGIDTNNRLHIGPKLVHTNVTDFAQNSRFLLFVGEGARSVLFFMAKEKSLADHLTDRDAVQPSSYRMVESDAKIVHVDEKAVVMQPQRGNLEVFYPRAFSEKRLKAVMERRRFGKALGLALKHKINLNQMVNALGVPAFVECVADFVAQIEDSDGLNVFLSALADDKIVDSGGNGDVFDEKTRRSIEKKIFLLKRINKSNSLILPGDVLGMALRRFKSPKERILERFLTEMTRIGEKERALPLATTIFALFPSKPQKAIKMIGRVHEKCQKTAEAALKFAITLRDETTVVNAALKTYDAKLALLALGQCKEYDAEDMFPFLAKIEALSGAERRFEIDRALGKNEAALFHLSACGGERRNECLAFIVKHGLFESAFKLWPFECGAENEFWKRVCLAYAAWLSDKKEFEKIALRIYVALGEWEKTLDLSIKTGHFPSFSIASQRLNVKPEDAEKNFTAICKALIKQKKYEKLGNAFMSRGKFRKAVFAFKEGKKYKKSIKTALENPFSNDAEKKEILNCLLDSLNIDAAETMAEISKKVAKLKKLLARLRSTRVLRENGFFKNADFPNEEDDTKSVSSVDTGFTWSTVSTFTVSSDVDYNNAGTLNGGKAFKSHTTKRLNFGHPDTEKVLVKEIARVLLSKREKKVLNELFYTLTALGLNETALQLLNAMQRFEALVEKEKRKPMDREESVNNKGPGLGFEWPKSLFDEIERSAQNKIKAKNERGQKFSIIFAEAGRD